MDQDVTHRISKPATAAAGPRYSLVWKMVLFPRDNLQQQQQQQPPTGSGGGDGGCHDNVSGGLPQQQEQQQWGGGRRHAESICRQEWGPPLRFGPARVAAWRNRGGGGGGGGGGSDGLA